jgi:Fe-Mn family superoxide dismutase
LLVAPRFATKQRKQTEIQSPAPGETNINQEQTTMTRTLPELGFAYDALEPHIDARTMEIHHTKHHAAYIANLDKAVADLPEWNEKCSGELISRLAELPENVRTAVRNNAGGDVNHTMFWKMIAPGGATAPTGDLAAAIDTAFGSFDAFKEAFTTAALTRFGSGWAWLCRNDDGGLTVSSTANQDNPLMGPEFCGCSCKGPCRPILGLDVWEHAYYLNYQNRRPDYVAAFWNVVNWDFAGQVYSSDDPKSLFHKEG